MTFYPGQGIRFKCTLDAPCTGKITLQYKKSGAATWSPVQAIQIADAGASDYEYVLNTSSFDAGSYFGLIKDSQDEALSVVRFTIEALP